MDAILAEFTTINSMSDVAFVSAKEFNIIFNSCSSVFELRLFCDSSNRPIQAMIEEMALPVEYADFADVFSPRLAQELSSHTPHDHTIETKDGQFPFGSIYLLSAFELDVLKRYIKNNFEKGFIVLFMSPAEVSILFIKKKNEDLRLCVDYWGLNALICQNKHPLLLINKVLDWPVQAKIYMRLDLKNAYNLICI